MVTGGQRSVSFTQRPDVAVDIRSPSGDLDLVLFDPKYKLDTADEESGIPVKSDVDKMHSYRDAIRDPLGEHLVRFAATLDPGRTQCYGREVAAISAVPGQDDELRGALRGVLQLYLHDEPDGYGVGSLPQLEARERLRRCPFKWC